MVSLLHMTEADCGLILLLAADKSSDGRPADGESECPPPHLSPRAHRGTAEEAKQQLYLEKYLPTDVLLRFFRVPGLTFSRGGSFSL